MSKYPFLIKKGFFINTSMVAVALFSAVPMAFSLSAGE
jgi:hypothetical protein